MADSTITTVCDVCGSAFAPAVSHARRCSIECQVEARRRRNYLHWLNRTGQELREVPPRKAILSDDERKASRRNRKHRRRDRCKDGLLTGREAARLVVGAKQCAICSVRLVDTPCESASKELDHIVPLCVGGKHVRENVRVLCRSCNQRRPNDGSDVLEVSMFQISVAYDPPERVKKAPKVPSAPRHSLETKQRAAYLRSEGFGYKRIAREIGVHRDTVRGWFRVRG